MKLEAEFEAVRRDLAEARAELAAARREQAASADALRAIGRGGLDLDAVLGELAASARQLCQASVAAISVADGEVLRLRAFSGGNPAVEAFLRDHPFPISAADPASNVGRMLLTRAASYIEDAAKEPAAGDASELGQSRCLLGAPLLRDGTVIGLLQLGAPEPGALTPRQIELVQSLADEAAIAVENARLFSEVKIKTDDLSELLQHKTATADVLKVIGQSISDAAPVFDRILDSCNHLVAFENAAIFLVDDEEQVRPAAARGLSGAPVIEALKAVFPQPIERTPMHRAFREGRVVIFADVANDADAPWTLRAAAEKMGSFSVVVAPMLWEGRGIGAIHLSRAGNATFTEKETSLLKTFADQAVIAIQNARLFNETRRALERQTATSEILKVIASSPSDAAPVFEAIAHSANRLLGGFSTAVWRFEGDSAFLAAFTPTNIEADTALQAMSPISIHEFPLLARLEQGEIIQLRDTEEGPPQLRDLARLRGYRAMLFAPLIQRGAAVGFVSVTRKAPGAFARDDVNLLQTFADQAVIGIENARLFNETQEALKQQTATADVLKVISRSVFDLQTVFETLLNTAVQLVGGVGGGLAFREGDRLRFRAGAFAPGHSSKDFVGRLIEIDSSSAAGRALLTGQTEYIPDADLDPEFRPVASGAWGKSYLGVPLSREGKAEGVLTIIAERAHAFTARHIELIQTFADQAVIAIENVRLFDEVQARTREIEEALAQQTATAEVLKVISRSAFGLKPVLQTLVDSAVRLCASDGVIYLRDGDVFRAEAAFGVEVAGHDPRSRSPRRPGRDSVTGRVALSGRVEQIPDNQADAEFKVAPAQRMSMRALLGVPLLRDGEVEGVFVLGKPEPGLFSDRAVELVRTFADQAVIAIQNVRLFDAVQAKTHDLEESLAQQTATADVLKVISRSAFDLDAVTSAILQTAAQLCRAPLATLHLRDGDVCRLVTQFGMTEAFAQDTRDRTIPVRYPLHSRRPVRAGEFAQFADALNDPEYLYKSSAKLGGYRAIIVIPMMRENELVGIFSLARPEPEPFTPGQIKLVQTFADQAAIAIENVRLFNEVKTTTDDLAEALRMQTATSDVLKVISRSAFDLQSVFNTLVTSAVELSGALTGTICVRDGDVFRYRDTVGAEHTSALARYLREHPAVPGRSTIAGRVLLSGKVEPIPDCLADPEYVVPMGALASNVRSLLGVPLLRKDGIEGALILTRAEPGEFTQRQIEIVQTFADQAVIALENVRLFDEVQARTRELQQSLDDLRKAQDRLVQSEKLASLGQLTAGIAHEIKNPLNFVNNFASLSRELFAEVKEMLAAAPLSQDARADIEELLAMLDSNLEKVAHHGKRADSIVKNMLLHSREGSGERARVNVNAMVEEALNLGYHGARAEKPGFNVAIEKALDARAGEADLYFQEISRVLLNLISNGFYATAKRKQGEGPDYQPTLSASTHSLGDRIEIRIRDNGTGIPSEVREKMFNPFYTTKPAGEGTGLGLSLSHDIVVKQHGGTIDVETAPGVYTEFIITLPREGAKA